MRRSYQKIYLWPHARDRRDGGRDFISEPLVRRVIENSDTENPGKFGRRKACKRIGEWIYTVIYEESEDKTFATVVTAWRNDAVS